MEGNKIVDDSLNNSLTSALDTSNHDKNGGKFISLFNLLFEDDFEVVPTNGNNIVTPPWGTGGQRNGGTSFQDRGKKWP